MLGRTTSRIFMAVKDRPRARNPAAPFQIWVEQGVYHKRYKCRLRNFNPGPDGKWHHNCGSAMQRNPHDSRCSEDLLREWGVKMNRRLNNQIASCPHWHRGLSMGGGACPIINVSHMAHHQSHWLAPARNGTVIKYSVPPASGTPPPSGTL